MQKTTRSPKIIDFLMEDKIGNSNILGILENEPKVDIYVDNAKFPKGVLVRNGYFNYIYTKDENFVIEAKEVFFKNGHFGFSGVSKGIAQILKKGCTIEWENECYLLYLPSGKAKIKKVRNRVSEIDIKDANIIDEFYTYRHDGSLEMIKDDIKNRPTSAIYKDGKIASWVLVHNDNSMGIMYTREEYRKLGYAYDVTIDLASKLIKNDKVPFIHIVKNNTASLSLAKKSGFEVYGEVSWFGIASGKVE